MSKAKPFFFLSDDEPRTLAADLHAARGQLLLVWRRLLARPVGRRRIVPGRRIPASADDQGACGRLSAAHLALMRCELRLLLDRNSSARTVLHHLALLERALDHDADRVFVQLPLPFLRKALAQLEGIVTDWRPRGLADLRSRLEAATVLPERPSQRAPEAPQGDDAPCRAVPPAAARARS